MLNSTWRRRNRLGWARKPRGCHAEQLERRELLTISPSNPLVDQYLKASQIDQYATAVFGDQWQADSGITRAEAQKVIAADTWKQVINGDDNPFLTQLHTEVKTYAGRGVTNALINGLLTEAGLPASSISYYDWFEPLSDTEGIPDGAPNVQPQVTLNSITIENGSAHDGGEGGYLSVSNPVVDTSTASPTTPVTAEFVVTWHAKGGDDFSVHFETDDDTAEAGTEYQQTDGTLHFADGAEGDHATIPVLIYGGHQQQFKLHLDDPVHTPNTDGGEGLPVANQDGTASLVDLSTTPSVNLSLGTTPFSVDATTHNLKVDYNVAGSSALGSFEARLVAVDADSQRHTLMSKLVSMPTTTGSHSFTFNDSVKDAESPLRDLLSDYTLEVELDPGNALNQSNTSDDTAEFTGMFMDSLGVIIVQGSDDVDVVSTTIGATTMTVTLNASSHAFPKSAVSQLHIRTRDDDDEVTIDPATTDMVWIFGGDADDTLAGGLGTNYLDGGAGSDDIFITGGSTDAYLFTEGFDHVLLAGDDSSTPLAVNTFHVTQADIGTAVAVRIIGSGNDSLVMESAQSSSQAILVTATHASVGSTSVNWYDVANVALSGTAYGDDFTVQIPEMSTPMPVVNLVGGSGDALSVSDDLNAGQSFAVSATSIGTVNANITHSGFQAISIAVADTSLPTTLYLTAVDIVATSATATLDTDLSVTHSGFSTIYLDAEHASLSATSAADEVALAGASIEMDSVEFQVASDLTILELALYAEACALSITDPLSTLSSIGAYFYVPGDNVLTIRGSDRDDVAVLGDGEVDLNSCAVIYFNLDELIVDTLYGNDSIDVRDGAMDATITPGIGDNSVSFAGMPSGHYVLVREDDASDTLDFSAFEEGIDFDLSQSTQTLGAMSLTLSGAPGYATIIGTDEDDVLTADDFGAAILGGDGDDLLYGGAGDDLLDGGPGIDRLFGGPGDDELLGGDGDDVLDGDAGADILGGDSGDDLLFGGADSDSVGGGPGDDTLIGDAEEDLLDDDEGNNTFDESVPLLASLPYSPTGAYAFQNERGDIYSYLGYEYTVLAFVTESTDERLLEAYGEHDGQVAWRGTPDAGGLTGYNNNSHSSSSVDDQVSHVHGRFYSNESFRFWYNQPSNGDSATGITSHIVVTNDGTMMLTVNGIDVEPGDSYEFTGIVYAGHGNGYQHQYGGGTSIEVSLTQSSETIVGFDVQANYSSSLTSPVTFELLDAPAGTSITSVASLMAHVAWSIDGSQGATYRFDVRVAEAGNPDRFDDETYLIVVLTQQSETDANWTPVARDDLFDSADGELLEGNLLSNDYDESYWESIHIDSYTNPAHAQSFTLNPDGTFTYLAEEGFSGVDSFTYQVTDGVGKSNTARVKVASNASPKLFARTIQDDAGEGSFNATNGWLPRNEKVGNLSSGKGIYLPLDTDDDDNNGKPDNAIVKGKRVAPPLADNDLLEIVVQRPSTTYTEKVRLRIPGGVVVWKKTTEGYVAFKATEDLTFGTSRSLTLYLQGVGSAPQSGILKVRWYNQVKKAWVEDDKVNVYTFDIRGPRNVPDFSIYEYEARGGASMSSSAFIAPLHGDEEDNTAGTVDKQEVLWTDGATFGKVRYQASPNYTWAFDVAIVKVDLDFETPGASEFKVETNAANKPVQNSVFRNRIDSTTGRSGPNEREVQLGVALPAERRFLDDPAMSLKVTVEKIEGPQRTINGQPRMFGVSHIEVGFVQSMKFTQFTVLTQLGPQAVVAADTVALDAITRIPKPNAIYRTMLLLESATEVTPVRPYYERSFGFFTSNSDVLIENKVIKIIDTPMGNGKNLPNLTGYNMIFDFHDYFVVRTKDDDNDADAVYTQRAVAAWRFDGSGTFASNGVYTFAAGAGLTKQQELTPKTNGDEVPAVLLDRSTRLANDLLRE